MFVELDWTQPRFWFKIEISVNLLSGSHSLCGGLGLPSPITCLLATQPSQNSPLVSSCLLVWELIISHLEAPLSVGCSRQEYYSGLLCPPSGDPPDLGVCKPESTASNAFKVDSLPPEPPGKPIYFSTQRLFSEYAMTWYTCRGSSIKIKLKLLSTTMGPCAHVCYPSPQAIRHVVQPQVQTCWLPRCFAFPLPGTPFPLSLASHTLNYPLIQVYLYMQIPHNVFKAGLLKIHLKGNTVKTDLIGLIKPM